MSTTCHHAFAFSCRDPVVRVLSDYAHEERFGADNIRKAMSSQRARELHDTYGPNTFPDFNWLIFHKNGSVDTELQLIKTGIFADHLRRYLQHFPMDQIHVVDGSRFAKCPWEELKTVEKFLNIKTFFTEDMFEKGPKGFYCYKDSTLTCMPKDKGRKHPDVSSSGIRKLKEFYRPRNEELYKILYRRFDW